MAYKGAIQEKRFEYKGYPCVIIMRAIGFRTGYVGLPVGHKYYRKHYDEIPVGCHGGLTYSADHLIDQTDENVWWIGFDTGHYGDGYDYEKAIELFKNYPETVKEVTLMAEINAFNHFPARSLEYVEANLKEIVNQFEVGCSNGRG